jgi:formylmethanofuran dehydrogenase subunit A
VKPAFDRGIERDLKTYFERYQTVRMENFRIGADEMHDIGRGAALQVHACRNG